MEDIGRGGEGGGGGGGRNVSNVSSSGSGILGGNSNINLSSGSDSRVGGVVGVGVGTGGGGMIDWSHPIYRSVQGYLGYEWGTFSDNCHKPPGLWPLSTTTHTIQHGLMEKYGALYRGSGTVTHRLSLYRTQPSNVAALSATVENGGVDKSLSSHNDNGAGPHQGKGLSPPWRVSSSALVFGAGTVQWSFALSSFHDGGYIATGGWVNGGGSRTNIP